MCCAGVTVVTLVALAVSYCIVPETRDRPLFDTLEQEERAHLDVNPALNDVVLNDEVSIKQK